MTLFTFTQTVKFILINFVVFLFSASISSAAQTCDPALLKRAQDGDVNAQSYIAHFYISGESGEKDYQKARYWYQRVTRHKTADAKIVAHANLILGLMYNTGKGGDINYTHALHCFQAAAEQGYYDAHISIGNMYAQGLGVKKDYKEALFWWRLAMIKGHPKAAGLVNLMEKEISGKHSG